MGKTASFHAKSFLFIGLEAGALPLLLEVVIFIETLTLRMAEWFSFMHPLPLYGPQPKKESPFLQISIKQRAPKSVEWRRTVWNKLNAFGYFQWWVLLELIFQSCIMRKLSIEKNSSKCLAVILKIPASLLNFDVYCLAKHLSVVVQDAVVGFCLLSSKSTMNFAFFCWLSYLSAFSPHAYWSRDSNLIYDKFLKSMPGKAIFKIKLKLKWMYSIRWSNISQFLSFNLEFNQN